MGAVASNEIAAAPAVVESVAASLAEQRHSMSPSRQGDSSSPSSGATSGTCSRMRKASAISARAPWPRRNRILTDPGRKRTQNGSSYACIASGASSRPFVATALENTETADFGTAQSLKACNRPRCRLRGEATPWRGAAGGVDPARPWLAVDWRGQQRGPLLACLCLAARRPVKVDDRQKRPTVAGGARLAG